MNVAVVDVGSNTARLLVARLAGSGLLPLDEGREHLFLGEDVERDGVCPRRGSTRQPSAWPASSTPRVG